MTDHQTSQISIDEWGPPVPPAMLLIQGTIEEWGTVNTVILRMVVTQAVIEEWASVAQAGTGPPSGQARVMVMA
jgi:hypothetical protein